MNRAWIPAGALAGVSVAGLIALGQLSHSLDTQVSFPGSVIVDSSPSPKAATKPVALDVNEGTVGHNSVTPAVSTRGGQASVSAPPVSGDSGPVGYRIPSSSTSSSHSSSHSSTAPKTPVAKKTAKRQNSIGAQSGPNGDNGLAGAGSGSGSNVGSTSSTLGPDAP